MSLGSVIRFYGTIFFGYTDIVKLVPLSQPIDLSFIQQEGPEAQETMYRVFYAASVTYAKLSARIEKEVQEYQENGKDAVVALVDDRLKRAFHAGDNMVLKMPDAANVQDLVTPTGEVLHFKLSNQRSPLLVDSCTSAFSSTPKAMTERWYW